MKIRKWLMATALFGASLAAQASYVVLPGANDLSAGYYGDFTVYSLDLLSQCAPLDPRCTPFTGDKGPVPQLFVSSQQLDGQMIVYRNENGSPTSNYVSGPLAGGTLATSAVDNPFDAPTGGQTSFNMTTTNEPMTEVAGTTGTTQDFTSDVIGQWDAKLSTVLDYVGGGQVVFLFDNNQQGNDVSQQQFFYATLTITDANGVAVDPALLGTTKNCFELTSASTALGGAGSAPGGDCGTFTDYTDLSNPGEFIGSGGGFCVDASTGESFLLPGNVHPTTESQCQGVAGHTATGNYFVNNNLGQNTAEFAVMLDALNQHLAEWAAAGYSMSINFKMRNLNDGGEELWIAGINAPPSVPEPGTIALAGIALLALGTTSRRRRH